MKFNYLILTFVIVFHSKQWSDQKISKISVSSICSINELLFSFSSFFDQSLSMSSLVRDSDLECDEIDNICNIG